MINNTHRGSSACRRPVGRPAPRARQTCAPRGRAEKRHLDLTAIEVARKVEDMHLQRDLLAAKGGRVPMFIMPSRHVASSPTLTLTA